MPPPTTNTSQTFDAFGAPGAAGAPGSVVVGRAVIGAGFKQVSWGTNRRDGGSKAVAKFAILFFFFLFSANMRVSGEGLPDHLFVLVPLACAP
jgi:hypothetical protein